MNPFGGHKLFKHLDYVAVLQSGGVPPPVTVEFDLTGRCNHKCPKCSGGYHDGDMELADAMAWLGELEAYGVRGVTFTGGGEPLMHKNCIEVVERASSLGLSVGFITNGSLMTAITAQRLVDVCEWVRVSIDGWTEEEYLKSRGVSHPRRAWEAVRLLGEAAAHCTVGVGYLYGKDTAGGLLDAAVYARELGANYIQVRPFHWESYPVPSGVVAACRNLTTDRFEVQYSEFKYAHMNEPRPYDTCLGAWFTGVIQADGNVPLCCHLRGCGEWYIGSLHRESFQEIWESKRHAELIRLVDVDQCVPLCRNDPLNRDLAVIMKPVVHENHL